MKTRKWLIVLAFLAVGGGEATSAPGTEPNAKARHVIDQAVIAMGGAEAFAALKSVRREMIDNWVDTGQGQHPWTGTPDADHLPVHFPETVVSFIDYADDRWFESDSFADSPGDYGAQVDAATSTGGFETFTYTDEKPFFRALGADERAAQHARRFRRFPEGILRMALARAETLQWVGNGGGGGRHHDVIALTDPAGTRVVLHFDAATHLLAKSVIERDHAILGDTTAETLYSDYKQAGKLLLPFFLIDRIAGVPTHNWPITKLEVDGGAPASAFDPPRDFVRTQEPPAKPTLHALGNGVFEILGPYNVMFAVFRDYVLLVEAPVGEKYTDACLDLIRSVAPGKPVRAVATHFHYDHIGGARTLIAEGIPIATTPDAVTVIRQAVAAPHTMHPDRLSKNPRAPQLDTIVEKRILDDATQRVEIYDFGPTPHVAQILIAYFPKTKALLVPDLLDTLTPEMAIPGIDAIAMIKKIKEYKLDIERILPVHGVPIAMEDLNRGLAIRARHVPGTPLDARP